MAHLVCFAAAEAKRVEDKRPAIMTRPSVMEWLAKDEKCVADGTQPVGRFAARINAAA